MQNSYFVRFICLVCSISIIFLGCEKQQSNPTVSTPVVSIIDTPIISLPPVPKYSKTAVDLIVDFEVTSEAYYNKHYIFPTWPEGDSGVTIAVGDDVAFKEPDIIKQDYHRLSVSDTSRLSTCSGINGIKAKAKAQELHDILVSWDIATEEFQNVELNRTYSLCTRTFPGFDKLRLNAQGSILSLVYNRGGSLAGPSRLEMRNIKDMVPNKDYNGMADQIRKMERLWPNTPGLVRRREAESQLMLLPDS